jgi:ribokinase
MIGAVGRDANGTALRRNLQECRVDVTSVLSLEGVPTGIALIAVSEGGENSIIVV